jgi:hypothetical protein
LERELFHGEGFHAPKATDRLGANIGLVLLPLELKTVVLDPNK